ncbi:hypothetical protein ANCDUO_26379 [Ancylostoma duodenale]|uniref:Cytochrome b561 domain-containing protein n=1 Tax=Ancylostoma duodenale TaxID=51022 RepID=A0A0C2FF16_9BILA|nr:hypothetical protein ANCDUO_26379 [Ancylostoma duodenale]
MWICTRKLKIFQDFVVEYAVGFITFFAPGLSIPIRQLVMPFHQLIGMMIFVAVSITVGMGISERAAWKHTCWTKGRELCGQQAVANLVGVCVFFYSVLVLILVANPRWKRRPLPEEESLHQLTATTSHD